jgi:hypothetical protein
MADEIRNGESKVRVVRLLGHRDDPGAWQIRDFLKRSVVKSQWIELSTEEDCRRELGLSDLKNVSLPVVELPDGTRLFGPTLRDVADRLGFVTKPRLGLSTVLIERSAVGGQAGTTSMIENYMGFPQVINGADLAERARQQAVKFGVELLMLQEGIKSKFHDDRIWTDLADGGTMVARANVYATGVEWRRLSDPRYGRESGSARCQMQELSARKFHDVPNESGLCTSNSNAYPLNARWSRSRTRPGLRPGRYRARPRCRDRIRRQSPGGRSWHP